MYATEKVLGKLESPIVRVLLEAKGLLKSQGRIQERALSSSGRCLAQAIYDVSRAEGVVATSVFMATDALVSGPRQHWNVGSSNATIHFNDTPGRTLGEVLAFIDLAIDSQLTVTTVSGAVSKLGLDEYQHFGMQVLLGPEWMEMKTKAIQMRPKLYYKNLNVTFSTTTAQYRESCDYAYC